jgi:hypothetical protein
LCDDIHPQHTDVMCDIDLRRVQSMNRGRRKHIKQILFKQKTQKSFNKLHRIWGEMKEENERTLVI